jgi:hypothetical protein
MNDNYKIFLNNLHRNFKFVCNNKVLKEGRMILFNFDDFYYSFTLDLSGNRKQFKMPMAYCVSHNLSSIRLDYTLKTLCYGIDEFENMCKMIKPKSRSPYYDSVVDMVFI